MDKATQIAIAIGVVSFAFRELYATFQGTQSKMQNHVEALRIELATLRAQMEFLNQNISEVHKLRQDVNKLWSKLRERQP